PLTLAEIPPAFTTGLRERDGSVGRTVLVYPRPGQALWQGNLLADFVARLRAAAAVNSPPNRPGRLAGSHALSADILASVRRDGAIASATAFFGVVLVVVALLRFRFATLLVLGSLVLGVLVLAALAITLNIRVNFANFIAFPITFGIGVDYAVNVASRWELDGAGSMVDAVQTTGGAVTLCSLTTIIGYSSLLLAENRALFLFGLLAVLGEVACLTTAVVVMPAFVEWISGLRGRIEDCPAAQPARSRARCRQCIFTKATRHAFFEPGGMRRERVPSAWERGHDVVSDANRRRRRRYRAEDRTLVVRRLRGRAMSVTFACPAPIGRHDRVVLGHGGGGRLSAELVESVFVPAFRNDVLAALEDQATLTLEPGVRVAVTTDAFVVEPIFFPGGDIGRLAVCGTVNTLVGGGAIARFITAAFVIEEGMLVADLERIARSMRAACDEAGVSLVAGDTKVVERGKGDQVFITTTGLGTYPGMRRPLSVAAARPGDRVLVTGTLGDHGIAIHAARLGL